MQQPATPHSSDLWDHVGEAETAVPALKGADLKAVRAGRNRYQFHAAFTHRTSGTADRKQARFGARM
jgi:hypothetical protein